MNTGSKVGVITFASCNHLMAFFWRALSMVPPSTEFSQTALSTQLRVLLSSTSARFSVFYTDTPLPRSEFTVLSALKIWQFLNLSPLGADITSGSDFSWNGRPLTLANCRRFLLPRPTKSKHNNEFQEKSELQVIRLDNIIIDTGWHIWSIVTSSLLRFGSSIS